MAKISEITNILIIDPAWSGPTGWLKSRLPHESCGLYRWGTLKEKEAKTWSKRFDLLAGIGKLIIENTYMAKNVATYGKLERAKMLWSQDALDHFNFTEKDIIYVSPQTWQSKLQRGWRPGKTKDIKQIENYISQRWFNGSDPKLTEHEISCFGMLTWWVDERK